MKSGSIKKFLVALGSDIDSIVDNDEWINARCPMAPYTHAGGADTRASFGVAVNNEGPSYYYCFGCMPEGRRLNWVLHNMFVASGRYPIEAARIFSAQEIYDESGEDKDDMAPPERWEGSVVKEEKPLPAKVLKKFPLLQSGRGYEARRCKEYMRDERGIPVWVQNMYRVRFNEHRSTIVFPLTDRAGSVFVMRERSRKEKSIWTVSAKSTGMNDVSWPRLRDAGVWFGMFLVDWRRPIITVEGEFDAMRLAVLGYQIPEFNASNIIASATSSLTDAQIDAVAASCRSWILGFDDDKGGEFACNRVLDRVGDRVNLFRMKWGLADNKDGNPCKDPGELPNADEAVKVIRGMEPVNLDKK